MSLVQEPSSIEKIAEVDIHIGAAMSGLTADARTLVDHARVEAQVRNSARHQATVRCVHRCPCRSGDYVYAAS